MLDPYGSSVDRRLSAGELQQQGEAAAAFRARLAYLERVERAAKRLVDAIPYHDELTDYVEYEIAYADLRALLEVPGA